MNAIRTGNPVTRAGATTRLQPELPLAVGRGTERPRTVSRRRTAAQSGTRWTVDGRQLECARIIANLTYQQLAAAAHVDRATLSDMLNGRRSPTLGSVHAVIRALNLDPAAVLVFK